MYRFDCMFSLFSSREYFLKIEVPKSNEYVRQKLFFLNLHECVDASENETKIYKNIEIPRKCFTLINVKKIRF